MLEPTERRNLKKSTKRLLIFLLPIFLLDAFIAYLFFEYTNMHPVLCGFIIIVFTSAVYLIFMWVCAKIDKKKEKKREEAGKKDPFTRT